MNLLFYHKKKKKFEFVPRYGKKAFFKISLKTILKCSIGLIFNLDLNAKRLYVDSIDRMFKNGEIYALLVCATALGILSHIFHFQTCKTSKYERPKLLSEAIKYLTSDAYSNSRVGPDHKLFLLQEF